jgi:hypothetical protein
MVQIDSRPIHVGWAKQIETLDPTSDSEIPEHLIELLQQHTPVPESSPSSPGKQSHPPQTPGSTHSYHEYGGQKLYFQNLPSFQRNHWHKTMHETSISEVIHKRDHTQQESLFFLLRKISPVLHPEPSIPIHHLQMRIPLVGIRLWVETPSQMYKPANHRGILFIGRLHYCYQRLLETPCGII